MSAAEKYDLALFFHLLGAFLYASGSVVAAVAFEAGRRRERVSEIALLLGLTRVGVVLVSLGAVLAFGFGMWLVDLGSWGYGAPWVSASLAILLVSMVLGGIGGQRPKRARLLARRLAEEDAPVTPELRKLLDDRFSLGVNYLLGALVIALVALMVWKPGS